jgi:YkoY family integral membrane protein
MDMITSQDLLTVGFLVFLEGILSIDNALVLAMLARDLPHDLQKRALAYGLIGAIVFRMLSLTIVTYLMRWIWVKFLGGGYLVLIALKHFFRPTPQKPHTLAGHSMRSFWKTVILIELTDIAFAIDSILAAVAVTKKFWVVFTGGFLGVVLMRIAASQFLKLLDRFPRFESTAYQLVLLIGAKLILEGCELPGVDFHDSSHWVFWAFWAAMGTIVVVGFLPSADQKPTRP